MVELLSAKPEQAKSKEEVTQKAVASAAALRWINRQKIMSGRLATHAYWWFPTLLTLLVVRFRAGRPVLGWDEVITWDASTRSIKELIALSSNIDGVLAPYYFFMHFWVGLFGDSEVALRTPSMLAATGAVAVTAVLARQLFSPKVGLLTGALIALMPAIARYGQEARPYGFALLFGALATLLLFRSLDRPSWWRWVGYGLSITLLSLFQLMGLLLLLAHAVVITDRWWREGNWKDRFAQRSTYLKWVLAAGMSVLLCLPLVDLAWGQRQQLYWLSPMTWGAFQSLSNDLFWSQSIGWIVVAVALFAGSVNWLAVRSLAAVALVPTVALYAVAFVTPSWIPRYVIYTLPVWCLLAVVAISTSRLRIFVVFALVLTLGFSAQEGLRQPTAHTEVNYRIAMSVIHKNYQSRDGMLYDPRLSWSMRPAVRYYLSKNRPRDVLALKTPVKNNSLYEKQCPDPSACLSNAPRVWVLRVGNYPSALDAYSSSVQGAVHQKYVLASMWHVAGITIELYGHSVKSIL